MAFVNNRFNDNSFLYGLLANLLTQIGLGAATLNSDTLSAAFLMYQTIAASIG